MRFSRLGRFQPWGCHLYSLSGERMAGATKPPCTAGNRTSHFLDIISFLYQDKNIELPVLFVDWLRIWSFHSKCLVGFRRRSWTVEGKTSRRIRACRASIDVTCGKPDGVPLWSDMCTDSLAHSLPHQLNPKTATKTRGQEVSISYFWLLFSIVFSIWCSFSTIKNKDLASKSLT